eukprot:jgi/Mesvir1/22317/Mv19633-RA.1
MWALPESATWIVIGLLGVLGVAGLGMLGYGAFKTLLGDYDEKRYREEEAKWKKLMIAGGVMVAVGVIGLGAGALPWERLADWWHSRNRVAPAESKGYYTEGVPPKQEDMAVAIDKGMAVYYDDHNMVKFRMSPYQVMPDGWTPIYIPPHNGGPQRGATTPLDRRGS